MQVFGPNSVHRRDAIQINQEDNEDVTSFCYLGSKMRNTVEADEDVTRRVGIAAAVFRLMNNIWKSKSVTIKTKITFFNSAFPIAKLSLQILKFCGKLFS